MEQPNCAANGCRMQRSRTAPASVALRHARHVVRSAAMSRGRSAQQFTIVASASAGNASQLHVASIHHCVVWRVHTA